MLGDFGKAETTYANITGSYTYNLTRIEFKA